MTWLYDSQLTRTVDQVRLLIRDTDDTDPLLQDEEISFFLLQGGTVYRSAALAAENIAGQFAQAVSFSVKGDLSFQAQQKFDQYTKLAAALRTQANKAATAYAGGISIADKFNREMATDRVPPVFKRDAQQEPGTEPRSDDTYGDQGGYTPFFP